MLGIATLMASRALLLAILLLTGILLNRRRPERRRRACALAFGILLVMVPWTVRNAKCFGEFIPLTTNGGINLYIGNNALATTTATLPDKGVRSP